MEPFFGKPIKSITITSEGVKIKGEFIWHNHKDTDETFIVMEGEMSIKFRDGEVKLCEGEMFVVPKGLEHMPCAEKEAKILLIEPRGVVNTGDIKQSELLEEASDVMKKMKNMRS